MPSAKAIDKYGAQMIVSFAADQIVNDSVYDLCKRFQELGWKKGERKNNETVVINLTSLDMLNVSSGISVHASEFAEFSERLKTSGGKGRVYLIGHGDWRMQTLGGYNAGQVAQVLKPTPHVQLVSIIGCGVGRELNDPATVALRGNSLNSFAAHLHKYLQGRCKEVYARTWDVAVVSSGAKLTGTAIPGTRNISGAQHHREGSKLHIYWNGSQQMSAYVSYAQQQAAVIKDAPDFDAELDQLIQNLQ